MRNVLLALIDAAPKPILFNGKATERLNSHYGLNTELLSLIESAWWTDAPREEEAEANAALRDFSTLLVGERIAPAMLRGLNRVREIMQEHLGYEPGEVSLCDVALVQWAAALVVRRAAQLSACAVRAAVTTVALQMGYVTGLGKDAQGAALSTDRNPFSIGIDGK
jgi:hexokinase